jgi:hypothetical protein
MSHRLRRMAAAVAAVGLGTSGCQALPGPLDYGNGGGTVCAPATTDAPWLIGDFVPTGDTAITIESVDLADAVGMELEGVWLTTMEGAIGAVSWPPRADLHWEDAVEAVGATIPPHTLQAIAFLVRPTADEKATASGLALTYTIGPFTYRDVLGIRVELENPCF